MFGRRKKRGSSKNSPKVSGQNSLLSALSVTPEMMMEAVMQSEIPPQMKESLLNELPSLVEHIDEATRKIYDPSAVWLESIQFADYVSQMAEHLLSDCGCTEEDKQGIAAQLKFIAETFKEVAENSMELLDQADRVIDDRFRQE
jgi:uncharacterized protein YjiS (DUF1127 family)